MVKPILTVPNKTLRKKSTPLELDKKTSELATHLSETLFAKTNPQGVGLSAPQIGKNRRIFVTWVSQDPEEDARPEDLVIFINPAITDSSKQATYGPDPERPILEGCLSIPRLYGPVPRVTWVMVRFTTLENGQFIEKEKKFTDFEARVILHEYDHLEGILFTDYSLKNDLPVYEFEGKKSREIDKNLLKAF